MDHCTAMVYLSMMVCWLLCNSVQLTIGGNDPSTLMSCTFPPGVDKFPKENDRQCFRRSFPSESTCKYTLGRIYPRGIRYDEAGANGIAHIFSPNKKNPTIYRSNRLCQYHIGRKLPKQLTYFEWLSEEFRMETLKSNVCYDFVRFLRPELLKDRNLLPSGIDLPDLDRSNNVCGSQSNLVVMTSQLPIKLEFLSNKADEYSGVHIAFMYVSLDENTIRSAAGVQPNCVNDITTTIPRITRVYQRGNRINVPRHTFITYNRQVLRIVQGSRTLRRLTRIRYFVVKTGLDGRRVFRGTARLPKNEIFGGGTLQIYRHTVYYVNYAIPPQHMPNPQERKSISRLLKATTPFFLDEKYDPPIGRTPPRPPPIRGYPGPRPSILVPAKIRGRRSSADEVHLEDQIHSVQSSYNQPKEKRGTRNGYDLRIDRTAFSQALQFKNACNIFLRHAARSYIKILDEKGILPRTNG